MPVAGQLAATWHSVVAEGILVVMSDVPTAADLWPLVSKLSPDEQRSLALLALRAAHRATAHDAAQYVAIPPADGEFSSTDEPLAWDADGWEDFYAPG